MPTEFYISIQGKFYKMVFNDFSYYVHGENGWSAFWNWFGSDIEKKASYNFYDLFDSLIHSASYDSLTSSASVFYLNCVDISKFVTLKEQNSDGQYVDLPKTSSTYNYLKVKVNYSENGALYATDSLFKQVHQSSTWNYYQGDIEDYWNAYTEINLTENNMEYIETSDGTYNISIDKDFVSYLVSLTKCNLNISINIDNVKYDVSGIDMTNFNLGNVTINISSEAYKRFNIINSSTESSKIILGGNLWQ